MAADMLSVLLERTHTLSEQVARLNASVSVLRQEWKLSATSERRELETRLREIAKQIADLRQKMRTEPIPLSQIMNTGWMRILAIVGLGLANVDLKHAIALVFQLK
jgi:hypothetical protein